MQISVDEKGVITPTKPPGQKLIPALFSFFALLLIVTGGISVISWQNQLLKVSRQSRGQASVGTGPVVADHCVVTGCSNQLCVDPSRVTTLANCEIRNVNTCYANATCRVQTNGHCGWTVTPELQACLSNGGGTASPSPSPSASVSPSPTASASPSPSASPSVSPSPSPSASPSPSPELNPGTGDFNNDGKVNLLDYTILVNEFLTVQPSYKADMNNDGIVNLADYTLFIQKL